MNPFAGTLGVIQEPSYKARWIANPNRFLQATLKPYGDILYHRLRNLSSDCTFDADKGVQWAQRQLKLGITLTCADLTAASDTLSLERSLEIIHNMTWSEKSLRDNVDAHKSFEEFEDYFRDVSRSPWHVPHALGFEQDHWALDYPNMPGGKQYDFNHAGITWTQGQPLGTYPSFAVMALTHNYVLHCVAASMAASNGYSAQDPPFRVLGDDVVMHAELYPAYKKAMEHLGVEINPFKAITSNRVAEFAGHLATTSEILLKRIKYRDTSDHNFLEVAHQLGEGAAKVLKSRQRKAYKKFKYIPGGLVKGNYPDAEVIGSKEHLPLAIRTDWYYLHSGLHTGVAPEPPIELVPAENLGLYIKQSVREILGNAFGEISHMDLPFAFHKASQQEVWVRKQYIRKETDPRFSTDGKSKLDILEELMDSPDYRTAHDTLLIDALDQGDVKRYEKHLDHLKKTQPALPITPYDPPEQPLPSSVVKRRWKGLER